MRRGRGGRVRRGGVAVAMLVVLGLGPLASCEPVAGGQALPPADTSPYGATGRLPEAVPGAPAEPVPGPSESVAPGDAVAGIPAGVLAAYRHAATALRDTAPGCHLPWWLVAGIGRIESSHARGGSIDGAGTTTSPILGPRLDGTAGNAAIVDTDGGALDRDTTWDRAVGPTQFIPSTWRAYGADGNGDGRADPANVYDAAVATGRYLCAGGTDVADPAGEHDAVFRYNHSESYVASVLRWAHAYANGVAGTPDAPGETLRGEAAPTVAAATVAAPMAAPAAPAAPRGAARDVSKGPFLTSDVRKGPLPTPAAGAPTAGAPTAGAPTAGAPTAGAPAGTAPVTPAQPSPGPRASEGASTPPDGAAASRIPASVCDALSAHTVAAALGIPADGLAVRAERVGDGVRCSVAGAEGPVLRAGVVPAGDADPDRPGVVVTTPDGGRRLVALLGARVATLTIPAPAAHAADPVGLTALAARLRRGAT